MADFDPSDMNHVMEYIQQRVSYQLYEKLKKQEEEGYNFLSENRQALQEEVITKTFCYLVDHSFFEKEHDGPKAFIQRQIGWQLLRVLERESAIKVHIHYDLDNESEERLREHVEDLWPVFWECFTLVKNGINEPERKNFFHEVFFFTSYEGNILKAKNIAKEKGIVHAVPTLLLTGYEEEFFERLHSKGFEIEFKRKDGFPAELARQAVKFSVIDEDEFKKEILCKK